MREQPQKNTEVEIMEAIDYGDTDYRYEMGSDRKYDDYNDDSLGEMGYQAQEFDDESGELISAEDGEEEGFDDEEYESDLDSEEFDGDEEF